LLIKRQNNFVEIGAASHESFSSAGRLPDVPLSILLGVTVDVSPLMRFHWYQPVFYAVDDALFPSSSKEALVYFVGISTNMAML
jgi:hypothetical protein